MNQDEQKISFALLEPIWMNSLGDDSPIISGEDGRFSPEFLNACDYVDYIGNIQNDPVHNTHPSFLARLEFLYGIVTGTKNMLFSTPVPLQDFYNLEKIFLTQKLFFDFKSLSFMDSRHADIAEKAKKQVFYGCIVSDYDDDGDDDDIDAAREGLHYMYAQTAFDLSVCKKVIKDNPVVNVSKQLVESTTRQLNFIDTKRDAIYKDVSTQKEADNHFKERCARATLLFHYTSIMANSLALDHDMPLKNRLFFLTQTRRAAYCESKQYKTNGPL